jgi:hypothetical protein
VFEAATGRGIDEAIESLAREKVDALFVTGGGFFGTRRVLLAVLAARYAVPPSCSGRAFVEAGGLMSYGTNCADMCRQVGLYAAGLLKDAKPMDLSRGRVGIRSERAAKSKHCNLMSLARPRAAHEAMTRSRVIEGDSSRLKLFGHFENCDRALASKSAAAFAASNVSAPPLLTRSSPTTSALRRTSHIGAPSCVNTNNINSPRSVETAGLGHKEGSGFHSTSSIGFA